MASFYRAWMTATLMTASVATLAPASADQTYKTYRNARFGVSADVPADWKSDPPPENGDGLVFSSPDNAATLVVSGILNADRASAAKLMADELTGANGEVVTYRNKVARQVVISGTRDGTIFYRKTMLSCGDRVINHLVIEYPVAQKQAFDPLVSHVATSMRVSPGDQIPNCK